MANMNNKERGKVLLLSNIITASLLRTERCKLSSRMVHPSYCRRVRVQHLSLCMRAFAVFLASVRK